MSTSDTAKRRTISTSSTKYRTRKVSFFEYLCGVKPATRTKKRVKTVSTQTQPPNHKSTSSQVNIPTKIDLSDNIVKRLNTNQPKINPKIIDSKFPKYDANNIVYTPRSDFDSFSKRSSFEETNSMESANTLQDILDQRMLENDRLNSPVSSMNEPKSGPQNIIHSETLPSGVKKPIKTRQKLPSVVLSEAGDYDNVNNNNIDDINTLNNKMLENYSTLPPGLNGSPYYPEKAEELYSNVEYPPNQRVPDIIIDSGTIPRNRRTPNNFDTMSNTDVAMDRPYMTLAHENGRRQLMNTNNHYTMNSLGQKIKKPPSSLITNLSRYQQPRPIDANRTLYRTSSEDMNKYQGLPTKLSISQSSLNKPINNQNGRTMYSNSATKGMRPVNQFSKPYSQSTSTAF